MSEVNTEWIPEHYSEEFFVGYVIANPGTATPNVAFCEVEQSVTDTHYFDRKIELVETAL